MNRSAKRASRRAWPSRAVVLCAGFGARMRPLTNLLPKPLLPIWGKPILEHTLRLLRQWGVREVLINLHHAPTPMVKFLASTPVPGIRITFSYEPEIMGTGGAIKKAEWFVGDSWFWLVNGDILADLDPRLLVETCLKLKPVAALWMTDNAGPRTVEMKGDLVSNFASRRPGRPGTFTFCGLHLLGPAIFPYIPQGKPFSIVDAYSECIRTGRQIAGVCVPSAFWADAGTPAQYLQCHSSILERYRGRLPGAAFFDPAQLRRLREMKKAGVTIRGAVAVSPGARVAPGAILSNSVVWSRCSIGPRARVENAVVGHDARVVGRARYIVVPAEMAGNPALSEAIRRLNWDPRKTTVVQFEPRGSSRSFFRIESVGKSAIVVAYSLDRAENALYARHAGFLSGIGLRVPRALLDMPGLHVFVMEDVGDDSLLDRARHDPHGSILSHYEEALRSAARLHRIGASRARAARITLCEPFSQTLYSVEHRLFTECYLSHRLAMSPRAIETIERELKLIADRLIHETPVLIHRDLQSSNIMIFRGEPVFLDFQGMRLGPAAYDIASLLCDPYVSLRQDAQAGLLSCYARMRGMPVAELNSVFWWAAAQRLVQAIGAYARLSSNPETRSFEQYIGPALKMLLRALSHLPPMPRLRRLVSDQLRRM